MSRPPKYRRRSARFPFLLSLPLFCLLPDQLLPVAADGDLEVPRTSPSAPWVEEGRPLEEYLAESPLLEEDRRLVRRLTSLSLEEEASLYLGRGATVAASQGRRVRRLLRDPALDELERFDDTWLVGVRSRSATEPPLFSDLRELVQCKIMIVRNLHFRGRALSRAAVQEEYRRIQDARSQYRETRLFAGRRVVFAASYQRLRRTGQEVFGRSVTRRQLQRQASLFSFVQPGAPGQSQSSARGILRLQFSTVRPMTFFFEGHGRESSIKLGGGLDAGDLASLLALGGSSAPPIVISASCHSHGYLREVVKRLRESHPGRSLPLLVVPEEYGQDFTFEIFHDSFKSTALSLGLEVATIGSLLSNSAIAISVYVPDSSNRPMQIL